MKHLNVLTDNEKTKLIIYLLFNLQKKMYFIYFSLLAFILMCCGVVILTVATSLFMIGISIMSYVIALVIVCISVRFDNAINKRLKDITGINDSMKDIFEIHEPLTVWSSLWKKD